MIVGDKRCGSDRLEGGEAEVWEGKEADHPPL
jgi:hypothetical protein